MSKNPKVERRNRKISFQARFIKSLKKFRRFYFPTHWEDSKYMADQCEVSLRGSNPAANLLLLVIIVFSLLLLVWAHLAKIDEVAHGNGRVIPSGEIKTIQNLEGGIILEIMVKQGDVVEKNQPLLKIKNTSSATSYENQRTQLHAEEITIARLTAELNNKEMVIPQEMQITNPLIVTNQHDLLAIRKKEFNLTLQTLKQQKDRQEQSLKALKLRLKQQQIGLKIAKREMAIVKPLFKVGNVSEVEFLKQERQVNSANGEITTTNIDIISSKKALAEANQRIEEHKLKHKKELTTEMIQHRMKSDNLRKLLAASKDRVQRTIVRSPVQGTVNRLMVHTIGGVIKPGMDLLDIVPLNDTLLVKAKVNPKDIAFIRPNQEVKVKFSAYDFTTYGNLNGIIENITADTLEDLRNQPYYEILVRTERNYLEKNGKQLPIIPGMVATVDITTDRKSILNYIFKPILRGTQNAPSEN